MCIRDSSYTMLQRDADGLAEYKKVLELKPGLYEMCIRDSA